MSVDGFLGRWSRRKLGDDKPVHDGAGRDLPIRPLGDGGAGPVDVPVVAPAPTPALPKGGREQEADAAKPSLPTLQDAQSLTPESDFKPFLSKGVEPRVRNAAMKKLFADPRYNVMDRLDTYIDDYSQPEPIPEAMLRRMASAQFLGLFEEKEEPVKAVPLGDDADTPADQSVAESDLRQLEPPAPPAAQSEPPAPAVPATQATYAHTDLRLQPDDAAPAQRAGRSAG